jgi:hypothetical protein
MGIRLLRLFLAFSAAAWGVSIFGVFASWPSAVQALKGLGAGAIPEDRMLDYWLRMASGAFALIGGWYLLLALFPKKIQRRNSVVWNADDFRRNDPALARTAAFASAVSILWRHGGVLCGRARHRDLFALCKTVEPLKISFNHCHANFTSRMRNVLRF